MIQYKRDYVRSGYFPTRDQGHAGTQAKFIETTGLCELVVILTVNGLKFPVAMTECTKD